MRLYSSVVEQLPRKEQVTGSNPVGGSAKTLGSPGVFLYTTAAPIQRLFSPVRRMVLIPVVPVSQGESMTRSGLRFALTFVLLLLPLTGVWFFYRWIFEDEANVLVPLVLGPLTSFLCAYALTGGSKPHN